VLREFKLIAKYLLTMVIRFRKRRRVCSKALLPIAIASLLNFSAAAFDQPAPFGFSWGPVDKVPAPSLATRHDNVTLLIYRGDRLPSDELPGTEEIVLIHHTDCGMLTFTDDQFTKSIQDDTGIKPAWPAEAFPDLDEDVRQSIARIKANPFVPNKDSIRGFVFDVATGTLHEVQDHRHSPDVATPSLLGRLVRRLGV